MSTTTMPNRSGTMTPRKLAKTRRRRWLPYAGGLLLVSLIIFGMWPQPAPVELARAAMGTLRATVNEEGKTRIKERFTVSAPVAGNLQRIELKAGAPVTAGQTVLGVITPLAPNPLDARSRASAEARRDSAAASVAKAKAGHDYAARELKRFEQLYQDQTVSVQELETVQWRETAAARDLAVAESALQQAEAELATFAAQPTQTTNSPAPVVIKAPVNGRVLRVFEESARTVNAGMPLLELGNPAELEVVIEVLSRDGANIRPGTKVELEHWGGSEPLQAQVRLVEPAGFTKVSALGVEEQRVNVVADLVSPPEQRPGLGDQFRVEARIIVWETESTLKVPSGALFRHGNRWAAFVVANGRAQLRSVKVGRASETEFQVLDGIKEGEELILYPGDRIREGQRVKPITV